MEINKRKRLDDEDNQPVSKKPSIDVVAAATKAAELTRNLNNKLLSSAMVASQAAAKRVVYRPLLLDSQGRAIDEQGNLVKEESQVKVLAANVAAASANKKKENPYLAHRSSASSGQAATDTPEIEPVVDDRLKIPKRDLKGKKGLHFIDAGTFVKEADILQQKEERKLIAGYSSGRKNLEHKAAASAEGETSLSVYEDHDPVVAPSAASDMIVAPPIDSVIPAMEWWDEAFLPKELRDKRKMSKAAAENDDFDLLSLANNKTFKYIQHPVPVRPLGSTGKEKPVVLPTYMTKKELKRLRKATRREREQEKRDKQMMGLLPPPEPKFNLGNFMKVLGDQAVADPSKVELKVLQQMQQRVLNHENRNQSAKLTPKQKKEKKVRKLLEDTSKGVHVAVFRVLDLSHRKFQFKVDVNAQQHFLSGVVLLCEEPGKNLVVVEGGPKGVRKFVKLMTLRIPWANSSSLEDPHQEMIEGQREGEEEQGEAGEGGEEQEEGSDESDDDSEGGDGVQQRGGGAAASSSVGGVGHGKASSGEEGDSSSNRCDLLWQGMLPKRGFTGFKFHESKTAYAARKMLEVKNVGHYWDMLEKADQSLASSQLLEF